MGSKVAKIDINLLKTLLFSLIYINIVLYIIYKGEKHARKF